jgi:hypothetical protein
MGVLFGAKPLPPDLPLFLNGSQDAGLGLYNHSFTIALVTDRMMLHAGLILFIGYRIKHTKHK